MFYEAARRLVVITRSLLMTQLQVDLGGVTVASASVLLFYAAARGSSTQVFSKTVATHDT